MAKSKKEIKIVLKLQLEAGRATPGPPTGPILGQHGVNLQEFATRYNEATQDKMGDIIPCILTVYEDRSFDMELRTPPASSLIKKHIKLKKGSGEPNKTKVGEISRKVLREIAEVKLPDLTATDLNAATKIIEGTAVSMGLTVVD